MRRFFYAVRLYLIIGLLLYNIDTLANQTLTLVLDWFANPNHAPIFVAQQQGFFSRQGLDVKIITPVDPTDPPKWVAVGKADMALDYQLHVLLQGARGLPIRQVGTLIGQPLNCLVVLESSHIEKLSDLKGKQVAYSAPEIDLLILKTMLKQVNLSLQDVTTINVHYDLTQALISKKVDAVLGMMRNVELTQLQLLGHPGRAFYPEKWGVPSYSELVFIAHQNSVQDDRYRRFFVALNEGRDYLLAHPIESWQQFVSHHSELNTPLNKISWVNTLPYFVKEFQKINTPQCESLVKFLGTELNISFYKKQCLNPSLSQKY